MTFWIMCDGNYGKHSLEPSRFESYRHYFKFHFVGDDGVKRTSARSVGKRLRTKAPEATLVI